MLEIWPGLYSQRILFTPALSPGRNRSKPTSREHKLNRVVVASCTPRLHEPTFRAACESAGLNPYLLEMANIREHCSWVHLHDKEAATEKAKDLVEMAVTKAARLSPQFELTVPVTRKAMVIGGGVAGIQASLDMADAGYQGLSGRADRQHRRPHGSNRQDFPYHGLFHLHTCPQDERSGPPSEHRTDDPVRGCRM